MATRLLLLRRLPAWRHLGVAVSRAAPAPRPQLRFPGCQETRLRWLATGGGRDEPPDDNEEDYDSDDEEERPEEEKEEDDIELPPGINTEYMNEEEIETLKAGLRLLKAKEVKPEKKVTTKLDVSHLRAASNDPAQHHDKAPGFRLGSIYSIPQDEYDKMFSSIRRKNRVPLESYLHRVLQDRFLMIRPPAVEIIGHLKAFAGNRFPKAAAAEALREEWVASGRTLTVVPQAKAEAGEQGPPEGEEEQAMEAQQHKEHDEEEEGMKAQGAGEEGEEEEDDEYDLFGAEEDEDEEGKARAAKDQEEEDAGPKLRDIDIHGTLKLLAVDENLVHPDQRYDLPLTPLPEPGGDKKKSIFLIEGQRGVGKSASLYHVVHYARKHGWIVLLVPSAREYLHEGQYIKPSSHFKGFFDTPDLCQLTLQQWGQAHGHQFSQLAIQDPLVLERHGLEKGSTLVDLVAIGLERPKVASSVLVDLKTEVEKQRDYPVLVAVDEIGEWFRHSDYYYANRKIEAQHLSAVRVLRDLLPYDPDLPRDQRGGRYHDHLVLVAARSEAHPKNKPATSGKDKNKPVRPLGRTGYEVSVSRYSSEEFEAMYKFLAQAGLWGQGALDDLAREEQEEGEAAQGGSASIRRARMITGGNPRMLEKDAIMLKGRFLAPQNQVGKASKFAPDVMLSDLVMSYRTKEVKEEQEAAKASA